MSHVFRLTSLALVTLLASGRIDAQTTTRPPVVVLHAARMVDVVTGQLIANPHVVVEGARITAVNPSTLPANARTIELGDVTLLPGLMDAHTHLAGEIGPDIQLRPVVETDLDVPRGAHQHRGAP